MKFWVKKTKAEIKDRIFTALKRTVNFYEQSILGMPASHLDTKVFDHDALFLEDAPFISTLLHNPNNIGCHTLGESLHFFKGAQEMELELINLCATDIMKGEEGCQDGYVTSGGTEANLQAIWIYRNYFMREMGATRDEIVILCTEDTHYSIDKASDILAVDLIKVPVNEMDRTISDARLEAAIALARDEGKKYFIVIINMMTTMFGSVDDLDQYIQALKHCDCQYKIHVDGAYGGFFYPFSNEDSNLNFSNPEINSITLDAHKMVQAPYGTGIFLIRKGYMQYANTEEATYIEGLDYTLIGSRSGANAIAVWMILMKYGPYGWKEKIYILQKRTDWLCEQLAELGLEFYRHPSSNIITIRRESIEDDIAEEFGLVPDNHTDPAWQKIVVMDHVDIEKLLPLLDRIKERQISRQISDF